MHQGVLLKFFLLEDLATGLKSDYYTKNCLTHITTPQLRFLCVKNGIKQSISDRPVMNTYRGCQY